MVMTIDLIDSHEQKSLIHCKMDLYGIFFKTFIFISLNLNHFINIHQN